MTKTRLLLPFLLGLLASCGSIPFGATLHSVYIAPLNGAGVPYTENCTTLRVKMDGVAGPTDMRVTGIPVMDIAVFHHAQNRRTNIQAFCYVEENGTLRETGWSTLSVPMNSSYFIASGEGSPMAEAFARRATTSGIFPLILSPLELPPAGSR